MLIKVDPELKDAIITIHGKPRMKGRTVMWDGDAKQTIEVPPSPVIEGPSNAAKAAAETAPEWFMDAIRESDFIVMSQDEWADLPSEMYSFLSIVHR